MQQKNIAQKSISLVNFSEPWKDQIVEQHLIHSIQVITFSTI
jgi:hypothetical protein